MNGTDIAARGDLFILDFVRRPEILREQGLAGGITEPFVCEITAWCAELGEQLQALSGELGIDLLLMGGNGASLRFDAVAQRGSRDNDYLTTATEAQLDALMRSLEARFSVLPAPLFRARRIPAAGKTPLSLVSYLLDVPSLTVTTRETLEIKIEFHMEDELPPSQLVTGRPFSVGQDVTASLPALPYQIGLKLVALDDPPVGIPPQRQDVIPRQMHDIDLLARAITDPADWAALGPYVRRRYEKERAFRNEPLQADAPWTGIHRRLDQWANCDEDPVLRRSITAFQRAQIGRAGAQPMSGWRARARRIAVICRCAVSEHPAGLFERALAIERRLPVNPAGRELRAPRRAIAVLLGDRYTEHPSFRGYLPRILLWELLGTAVDLPRVLDEIAQAGALDRAMLAAGDHRTDA
jgi:Nucleotidyl transferase AbiEii toxin, Type IV TA system